jgi:DNA-binding Lrp family transcriptional regulator
MALHFQGKRFSVGLLKWFRGREMVIAFVLIVTEIKASEDQIIRELKKNEHVKEVYPVYGIYDIIVKIEARNMARLNEIIERRIRVVNGIRSTLTMIEG